MSATVKEEAQPPEKSAEENGKPNPTEGAGEATPAEAAKPAPPPKPPPPKPPPAPLQVQLYVWYQALSMVSKYSAGSPRLRRQYIILFLSSAAKSASQILRMKMNQWNMYYQLSGNFKMWRWSIVVGISSAMGISYMTALHSYAEKTLAHIWRDALQKSLHKVYFGSSNFYQIAQGGAKAGAIVDADVRLTDDVPKLASSVASLLCQMVGGFIDVGTFTVVLGSMGRKHMMFALTTQTYAILLYILSNYIIIVDWAGLFGGVAATEAALNQTGSRAENHAEAISSMQGGAQEKLVLSNKLKLVVQAKMRRYLGMDKLDVILYYTIFAMMQNTPGLAMLMNWGGASMIAGLSRGTDVLDPTKPNPAVGLVYSEGISIFWSGLYSMFGMFRIVVGLHEVLQNFAAIQRIQQLEQKLQVTAEPAEAMHAAEGNNRIEFKEVSIHTPAGDLLVDKVSFAVNWGEALLVTGQNGAGKSSIFRCMGGLWPVKNGDIWRPVADNTELGLASDVYYLPQRPYNALGTLMDQFCYPDNPPDTLTEKELRTWLDFVDLGYLADMPGALTEEFDWEKMLSRGEQQRLAIIRLFHRRPKFAILDECTSAVNNEMEKRLFDICPSLGISCITIAHRPALLQYHQRQLTLTGKPLEENGGWVCSDIAKGAAKFDPSTASGTEALPVIEAYFAQRAVQLKGVRQEETKDLTSARKKALNDAKAAKDTTAGVTPVPVPEAKPNPKPKSALHPDLFIGWKSPGARWRLVAAIVSLAARTRLVLFNNFILGELIVACTTNFPSAPRALVKNIVWTMIGCLVDRIYKRSCQRLSVMLFEGFASKNHELVMQNSAMHYGAVSGLTENMSARLGEINSFADAVGGFLEGQTKPICLALQGAFIATKLQGVSVIGSFVLITPLYILLAKLLAPSFSADAGHLADLNAKFKTVHSRFRQNLEPIAFSGGGAAEQRIIERRYQNLSDKQQETNKDEVLFQACTQFLTDGGLLPLSMMRILSWYYTAKTTNALTIGNISPNELKLMWDFQQGASMVFTNMGSVMRFPEAAAGMFAYAWRVSDFAYKLEEAAEQAPVVTEPILFEEGSNPSIAVNDVNVVIPKSGDPLALNVSLQVDKASALVVTGPNACGKSLLGASIAGLRPLEGAGPSVSVCGVPIGNQRPHMHNLLPIPQKPYLAPGSLGDQVAYPLPGHDQDQARLQECLDIVGIGYLVERHGGLDKEASLPWDEILSGGEQQRIGLCRCLFHKPVFTILDECTSMVSQETELGLYKSISQCGAIPITISQRLSLPEMHSQELQLGCSTISGWKLTPIEKK